MNREDAKKSLYYAVRLNILKIDNFINKIYDDFEKEKDIYKTNEQGLKRKVVKASEALSKLNNNLQFTSCDDCKNKIDNVFQEVCGNCKRFYGCYFESKELK